MSFDALPPKIQAEIKVFIEEYLALAEKQGEGETAKFLIDTYCTKVLELLQNPPTFLPFHRAIRQPFDYFTFGRDMLRTLVDVSKSKFFGDDNLKKIEDFRAMGHNVILFSNHQSEMDTPIITLFLEKRAAQLSEELIFVAGHRVVFDPVAIPFSLGTNMLCIFSKKYIDTPPEERAKKLEHNVRTLRVMEHLLEKGGAAIYVAPAGGRDRRATDGTLEVAPFDPDSIEMISLFAKRAKTPTHFFTLSLSTYDVMPPPETTHIEIGEERKVSFCPVGLFFGKEFDMTQFDAIASKEERKKRRAEALFQQVSENYHIAIP
jgi:glycerol-3-phosphate O-acyltransferase